MKQRQNDNAIKRGARQESTQEHVYTRCLFCDTRGAVIGRKLIELLPDGRPSDSLHQCKERLRDDASLR